MNPNNPSQNSYLLDAVCRQGVLVATSVRYWRGCKRLNPEDLGLDPAHVSDRLIQLGHKRLIPRDALSAFALIESQSSYYLHNELTFKPFHLLSDFRKCWLCIKLFIASAFDRCFSRMSARDLRAHSASDPE